MLSLRSALKEDMHCLAPATHSSDVVHIDARWGSCGILPPKRNTVTDCERVCKSIPADEGNPVHLAHGDRIYKKNHPEKQVLDLVDPFQVTPGMVELCIWQDTSTYD